MKAENHPLVSIIMIVKNGERFIRQAFESILAQSYHSFEILLVDGHSQDKTLEIASEFSPIHILQQQGIGASDAYNNGIGAANADFVAFLSYDDLWTPDKLTLQMNYLIEHPEIMFTNCHTTYFLEPGSGIPEGFRRQWLVGSHPARIMETLVARKTVFEEVGYFNNALRTAEDVDWYSRAADMNIPSIMLPEVLLNKRIHGANNSMEIEKNNQNLMLALRDSVKRKKGNL
jgi:glycosyltransferase involved in cell wall biosynthesis